MIDVIRESVPEQPFFSCCSFADPHHPFDPPEPYAGMYNPDELEEPACREDELLDYVSTVMDTRQEKRFCIR